MVDKPILRSNLHDDNSLETIVYYNNYDVFLFYVVLRYNFKISEISDLHVLYSIA